MYDVIFKTEFPKFTLSNFHMNAFDRVLDRELENKVNFTKDPVFFMVDFKKFAVNLNLTVNHNENHQQQNASRRTKCLRGLWVQ